MLCHWRDHKQIFQMSKMLAVLKSNLELLLLLEYFKFSRPALLQTHPNTISKMTKTIYKSERKEKKNHILYFTTHSMYVPFRKVANCVIKCVRIIHITNISCSKLLSIWNDKRNKYVHVRTVGPLKILSLLFLKYKIQIQMYM